MTIVLLRGEITDTHKKQQPCEERDWSFATTKQGIPGDTRRWKKQEKEILP